MSVCVCVWGGGDYCRPLDGPWMASGLSGGRHSSATDFLESTGVLTPAARRAMMVPDPRRLWWRRCDGRSEKRADVTLGQAEAVCTGHPSAQLVGRRPAPPLDLLLFVLAFWRSCGAPHWEAASGASL